MSAVLDDRPGSDAAARLDYLSGMAGLLWPGAERVRSRGRSTVPGELLVAPAARRPRLLLPADSPRAAATAVLAQGAGSGRSARLQRQALAALARAGLAPWLMPERLRPAPGSQSVVTHLADVLGRPVTVATALTPQRANRKPVLQLLDGDGTAVAWVKVGIDELTGALVTGEGGVLTVLAAAQLPELRIPAVLYRGTWHELPVLALSALPTAGATRVAEVALHTAMRALAATPVIPVDDARAYAETLSGRVDALMAAAGAEDRAALQALRPAVATLLDASRRGPVPAGTWHGDWTPWNCGYRDGAVLVWDWERCHSGVPLGFDALHYRMQDALVSDGMAHLDAARRCIATAPEVLAGWQLGAKAARLVAALYLIEIALRYIKDDQRAAGGYGGRVETWLVPALLEFRPSAD